MYILGKIGLILYYLKCSLNGIHSLKQCLKNGSIEESSFKSKSSGITKSPVLFMAVAVKKRSSLSNNTFHTPNISLDPRIGNLKVS